MAQEESCSVSHLIDSTVPNERTTAHYTEEIISIPDIVKYCTHTTSWSKDVVQKSQTALEAGLFMYHKTQMKLCYLYCYRARRGEGQTLAFPEDLF